MSVVLWSLNARVPFIMVTQVILVSPEHSPSDPGLKETIPLKSCFKLESRPSMLRENAYEEKKTILTCIETFNAKMVIPLQEPCK